MQTHATIHQPALPPNEINFAGNEVKSPELTGTAVADLWIASLKVLAVALLKQIQMLDDQMTSGNVKPFDLYSEVRRFETSLIRSALLTTGGRQRRAARLLGMKITTLNTKIKKLEIDPAVRDSTE